MEGQCYSDEEESVGRTRPAPPQPQPHSQPRKKVKKNLYAQSQLLCCGTNKFLGMKKEAQVKVKKAQSEFVPDFSPADDDKTPVVQKSHKPPEPKPKKRKKETTPVAKGAPLMDTFLGQNKKTQSSSS